MTAYDVVVVGARVAGASTAMLLGRAGLRVALLDRSRYGTDTLSTHGLMRAGVLQLSRWGLLDRVVAAGTPPVRHTTFHYADDAPVHISIRPGCGIDALYAPRRHVIDRILVDAAVEAGVDVLHETRVDALLRDSTGRVTGVQATHDERTRTLRSLYVVGADGIGSFVAREAGAGTSRQGLNASAVQFGYYEGLHPTGYEWVYGDGAAAGIIPTNDGLSCLFASTSAQRMRTLRTTQSAEQVVATLLQLAAPDQADRFAAATRVGPLRGWSGRSGHVRQSWGPGWALVGDAGYYKDPITAHGMTDALRDAELLAGAIVETLSGVRPYASALGEYQLRRDSLSAQLFQATEEIAAYDWDSRGVQPLLRRVSAAMTDEVELLESLPPGPFAGCAPSIPADDVAAAR